MEVEWLQRFDGTGEMNVEETEQMEEITTINVHTDQSIIVGLVLRLHGLGMTIRQVLIITHKGD